MAWLGKILGGALGFARDAGAGADFTRDVPGWLRDGRIVYREDIVDGIDNAIEGRLGLLRGGNFGKLVVKVSDHPTGGGRRGP